jgi:hypothetical protein
MSSRNSYSQHSERVAGFSGTCTGAGSAGDNIPYAGVMYLLVSEGTDLAGADLRHGDGLSIKGSKLNLVAVTAFIDVNNRPYIAHRQSMLRQIGG